MYYLYIHIREDKNDDDGGILFNSITEAMIYLGINNMGNISACLSGSRERAYGYKFMYVEENVELNDKEHLG